MNNPGKTKQISINQLCNTDKTKTNIDNPNNKTKQLY